MLGSALDMSFTDFFWYKSRPGMFFAVELGAVLSAIILLFLFRKEKAPIPKVKDRTKVTDFVPTALLVGTILLLIIASFIPNKPDITNGLICCGLLVVGLVYNIFRKKKLSAIVNPLKEIDFQTIGLLSGATLGGNCTPIGASANIAGIGILRKEGYTVKNSDFFKIGIPFTLAAIIPAYIYLWFIFG